MKIVSMLYSSMRMGAGTRERNIMAREMAMANSIIDRDPTMMATGRKIICMGLAGCTILTINWHMRAIGLSINFMDMAKFIMMNQWKLIEGLIILTLICWIKSGPPMKAHLSVIPRKDLASLYLLMESIMKETSKEIGFMARASLLLLLEMLLVEYGRSLNCLEYWDIYGTMIFT